MGAAAILDLDGTLVDTNYHHTLAWWRALRQLGGAVPLWRIHRAIGMGGDRLVPELLGDEFEREHGDEARTAEGVLYRELMTEVVPFASARALIDELGERGLAVVLASSAKQFEVDHYLDLLDARRAVAGWTSSADVEETKPAPDLVTAALEKVDASEAVMIGDSTYDCEAAARAGLESVALLTGGFSAEELHRAGATTVHESIEDLLGNLDATPLGALVAGPAR